MSAGYNSINFGYLTAGGGGSSPGQTITFGQSQFKVLASGTPITAGSLTLSITISENVMPNSVNVYIDGQFIEPDQTDTLSYSITSLEIPNLTMTFNQAASLNQRFLVRYATST